MVLILIFCLVLHIVSNGLRLSRPSKATPAAEILADIDAVCEIVMSKKFFVCILGSEVNTFLSLTLKS